MYQINQRTIRFAAEDCLVMHPGPINRGLEFDDRVPDGPQSVIHQQVENGVYVKMAVFAWLFETNQMKREVAV
jgi:aspartate carbamoyltransferase catalytic subunit